MRYKMATQKIERGSKKRSKEICMYEVLPLPNDFETWLKNKVFTPIMFFQKNEDKTYTGACTCGATNIHLLKAKNGVYTTCPACGRNVKLRNARYNRIEERKVVCYLQKTSHG